MMPGFPGGCPSQPRGRAEPRHGGGITGGTHPHLPSASVPPSHHGGRVHPISDARLRASGPDIELTLDVKEPDNRSFSPKKSVL